MTRVLPDPAPARTRRGPSVCRTASSCLGFRSAKIASDLTSISTLVVGARLTKSAVGAPLAAPPQRQGKPYPYAPANLNDCKIASLRSQYLVRRRRAHGHESPASSPHASSPHRGRG